LVAEDVGVVQGAFVEELHELGDKEDREDDELLKGESAQAYICEERVAYVELPSNLALFFGGEFDIQTGEVLLVSHVVVVPLRGMSFFEAFGGALGILHRSHFSLSRGVHGRMSSHDGFVRARILVFQTASSGRGSQRTVNEDDFERNQTGSQKINAGGLAFEGFHRVGNSMEAVAGISLGVVFLDAISRHFGTSGLLKFLVLTQHTTTILSGNLRAHCSQCWCTTLANFRRMQLYGQDKIEMAIG
jgi:hypothetical protein